MRRTRKSLAAKDAARLMAVVVLPTPPFWFAIAITLPMFHVERENSSCFTWNHKRTIYGLPKVTERALPTQCEAKISNDCSRPLRPLALPSELDLAPNR